MDTWQKLLVGLAVASFLPIWRYPEDGSAHNFWSLLRVSAGTPHISYADAVRGARAAYVAKRGAYVRPL